jgi:hypothetical protein
MDYWAHKPGIFLFENDGKAGGFLDKSGTFPVMESQYAYQRQIH